ncbi:hypothetical protein AVEN_32508-1 [Araneus ventricosus]|uniref:Uncharacterized protein n=1 Tax=Araneus ventricosus TaxID=182803 RepID=A0A4Y2M9U2_ARAVE|nr:hypothetical protein AVEN_32508-1 [Araneus ventricosus]
MQKIVTLLLEPSVRLQGRQPNAHGNGCDWQESLNHHLPFYALSEPYLPSKEANRLRPAFVAVKGKFLDRLARCERVKITKNVELRNVETRPIMFEDFLSKAIFTVIASGTEAWAGVLSMARSAVMVSGTGTWSGVLSKVRFAVIASGIGTLGGVLSKARQLFLVSKA